jgi:uncharacterized protein (TIGR03086 family)
MTGAGPAPAFRDGVALLERAVGYALGPLQAVIPAALNRPTPCAEWDLGALLTHMSDSLAAMHEAVGLSNVSLSPRPRVAGPGDSPAAGDPAAGLVAALRGQARQLLAGLAGQHDQLVRVGGYPLPVSIVASAGAVDIAVHGWDVAQACGSRCGIPAELAGEILAVSRLLVTEADRPTRFGSPVPVSPQASVGDQLVGYLGRRPAGPGPAPEALAG